MGRYLEKKGNLNALIPEDVVSKLIDNIFRFQKLFEGIFVFTAFALLLLLALVIALSLRLRSGEIQTMFKLGSSRSKIFEIITFETGHSCRGKPDAFMHNYIYSIFKYRELY